MGIEYKIKNRSAGVCVYRIPEDGIRRSFEPGETKKVSAEELEKLTFQPGGLAILSNFLQIIEESGRKQIGLETEPEYNMSEKDVVDMLRSGSMDAFLDCLDFAPPGVIDLIKKFSVSLPLTDYNKRKALKDKLGFDVDRAVENNVADKENSMDAPAKRRVAIAKEEEVKPETNRRTEVPKYNIVD